MMDFVLPGVAKYSLLSKHRLESCVEFRYVQMLYSG
ncbi:MAG: hypothetical protein KatS3mg031_0365 [Chitinophagales bacterium]|nr:MAG: hypothetical protein KatS3mg031_0365 [Chitinophagales bacterium]